MKRPAIAHAVLSLLLAAGFILLDLFADRHVAGFGQFGLLHVILLASVLLVSFILVAQARERAAELQLANEALRTSQETARALLNASPESALLLDAEGAVLGANERAAQRLDLTVDQLVGSRLMDAFPVDVASRRKAYVARVLETAEPVRFTDERAGRTFDNYVYPILDAEGRIIRIAAFGQDITQRIQAEDALRATAEKYRLLFQKMAEGFALYELLYDDQGAAVDWRVLEVNDAYERHTGIAREQIAGRRISELFPAAIGDYLPGFVQVVTTQTPFEFETYASAVGRYQRVRTFPAGGRRFASVIEDITERKRADEALLRTQEELALDIRKRSALEERQRLARELHDSVSQALYGISLGIHTAKTQLDSNPDKATEALDYALLLSRAGLAEMRALIFELRPESLEKEGLVTALIRQAEALRARQGIEVEASLGDEPGVSIAVKEALYRIAQEALQNAVKHAHANRLEIRLGHVEDGLKLEVRDDGRGFDPATEHPGHLGLISMRERAEEVGGVFEVISAPDSGTQIRVCIPDNAGADRSLQVQADVQAS